MKPTVSITAVLLVVFYAVSCRAKANVTLQLGLTYVGNEKCDYTPYKVTVCVGEQLKTCRLFGPHDFYVQASCASYGQQEGIEFVVEHVNESLRIDSSVKQTNSEKVWKLRTIIANLSESREIPALSADLLYVVRYRVSYNCVANYFGELCDVYCSSEAKEYTCGANGEKICNDEYIKDKSTGVCIRDQCKLMPNYCFNGGQCVNKAQDADTSTPTCICTGIYGGPQCEEVVYNLTSTASPSTPAPPVLTEKLPEKENQKETGSTIPRNKPKGRSGKQVLSEENRQGQKKESADADIYHDVADGENGIANDIKRHPYPPQMISESSILASDRSLWYQVVIFTIVAICLTVIAFGACIGAACYMFRLKAKAELLRRQQEHIIDDIHYMDSTNMPVYLKRCSSLEYNGGNNMNNNPSVQNFAVNHRPYTAVSPPANIDPEQQGLMFSNGPNRSPEPNMWSQMGGFTGTLHRSGKQWDYPITTFPSLRRPANMDMEMRLQGCDTGFLPNITPEAYSCQRPTTYGYLSSELNNQLLDENGQLVNGGGPPLNNSLSLRPISTRHATVFDDELTKNNFHDTCVMGRCNIISNDQSPQRNVLPLPFAPPNQFADMASN